MAHTLDFKNNINDVLFPNSGLRYNILFKMHCVYNSDLHVRQTVCIKIEGVFFCTIHIFNMQCLYSYLR